MFFIGDRSAGGAAQIMAEFAEKFTQEPAEDDV